MISSIPPLENDGSGTLSVETARSGGIEEIIVTGQKREERIQDVPIAISAFSSEDLNNQKIEGGFDLLRAVPNVTFSKTNFTGYNFQIRGIGTQAISATTDPGVAVSFNNTTLIVNRLFEQEYLDIERVEVLRGPQGTLFGRNATAGVINVISAKPKLGVHEGEVKLETGNYGAERLRAHYNLPLGDTLALRGAFASTVREGYGTNEYDGSDVDDRDLWTGRLTLGWQPHERLRANLLWERFRENDQRVRSIKQLCHRDEGLEMVDGLDLKTLTGLWDGYTINEMFQAQLTQGCLPGSLYDDAAFGVPNGMAIPFISVGRLSAFAGGTGYNPYLRNVPVSAPCSIYETRAIFGFINLCHEDPFAGAVQSRDLRTIHSEIKPSYNAESDVFELSVDFDVSDELLLSSQTVYVRDGVRSIQDMSRFGTTGGFFESAAACGAQWSFLPCNPGGFSGGMVADIAPGGVFCDPQLGCSDRYRAVDMSRSKSNQFNQELRLVSSFDGPVNYSVGANFTRFTTMNDYFVFINSLTALSMTPPFRGMFSSDFTSGSPLIMLCSDVAGQATRDVPLDCLYRDPQTLDQLANGGNPEGHNYFLSRNPYELNSTAMFGEVYWNATDRLKFTGGLRVTWDQKTFTPVPSQALLTDFRQSWGGYTDPSQCRTYDLGNICARQGTAPGGRGYPAEPDIVQTWLEPTGRLGFDWKPDLSLEWVDESLIYAFYTRGYKAGGANPPGVSEPSRSFIERSQGAVMPRVFKAEYVNAFEVGTKNRLFGNRLTANANLFYYDYENYQVSKIVNRSSANENFDAKVWGAELELLFAPAQHTLMNASVGYLHTRIADGEESIDLMDRTQGGGHMFVTGQPNPNYDASLPARARSDYEAGLNAPADQEFLAFDDWVLIKPSVLQTSNCIAPAELVRISTADNPYFDSLSRFCPGGTFNTKSYSFELIKGADILFDSLTDAPNGGAGFMADLGGKELPSAPRYTVSLGGQQTIPLRGGWDITGRVDWYWQDQSYARVYNTEYDRLKAWTNTSLSLWVSQPSLGIRIEAYVKNVFDETPITGTFLGSDDTALPTNVFTLDPRLVGVSFTKQF
jgi:iron complex outermembrane receptor protein